MNITHQHDSSYFIDFEVKLLNIRNTENEKLKELIEEYDFIKLYDTYDPLKTTTKLVISDIINEINKQNIMIHIIKKKL